MMLCKNLYLILLSSIVGLVTPLINCATKQIQFPLILREVAAIRIRLSHASLVASCCRQNAQ